MLTSSSPRGVSKMKIGTITPEATTTTTALSTNILRILSRLKLEQEIPTMLMILAGTRIGLPGGRIVLLNRINLF